MPTDDAVPIIMQDEQGRDVDVTKAARRWRAAKRKADKAFPDWQRTQDHGKAITFTDAYAEQCAIENTVGDLLGRHKRRVFIRLASGGTGK